MHGNSNSVTFLLPKCILFDFNNVTVVLSSNMTTLFFNLKKERKFVMHTERDEENMKIWKIVME